ncbi:MAG: TerC family protein [Mycobacterium sp.]
MNIPVTVWALTIALIVGLVLFDLAFHARKAHLPTLREAAVWSAAYVGIAVAFGVTVWIFGGTEMGLEYFAGYLTEKALSVDNLFVFLVIFSSFGVPRADQQKALLFGIVFSMFGRAGLIFIGAALINAFAWVFYLFGLILLLTAGHMVKPADSESRTADNLMIRTARRLLPATDTYDGDKLFTVQNGKWVLTPMLLVMVAIGSTDIMFALDSIPAIFGLTDNVYIVFTAIVFSLLGLRQLYFLIDELLDRLVYLSVGLAVVLGFIGVKLILHALHENNVTFINEGEPVDVVEIRTGMSLGVIMVVLIVTTVASLVSTEGKTRNAVSTARRHANEYLDLDDEIDPSERAKTFAKLCAKEDQIKALPETYRARIRDERQLLDLLRRAHAAHEEFQSRG